jgi:ribonuclease VapC
MVIDTSAFVAIVTGEEDAEAYISAIKTAFEQEDSIVVPASVILEAGIVLDLRGKGSAFDDLIESIQPEVVPITRHLADVSRSAYRTFGRGVHRAKLNFGDCMTYAIAKQLGDRILFKGDDFSHTDVKPAL